MSPYAAQPDRKPSRRGLRPGCLWLINLLIFGLLLGPFLVPVPPLEGVGPPETLADPDSRFIEVNGLSVHYKTRGLEDTAATSTPLILLHGFAASTFSWEGVLEPLSTSASGVRPVIAFDRPAFGLTERPLEWDGPNPYTLESQAHLTIGFMDALGIERAILVGNSAGGTVSVYTALQYPERVEALILVDPALSNNNALPAWLRPVLQTPQARRLGPLFTRRIQTWGLDFARRAWHDPSKITPEILEGYTKPLKVENWDKALWELTLASQRPDLLSQVQNLSLPVLVITGDDDRIVPTADSIRLAGQLPDAHLVVIPNCGHVPHEECPQPFLQAVNDFLRKLEE